jgi:hypothetical protein
MMEVVISIDKVRRKKAHRGSTRAQCRVVGRRSQARGKKKKEGALESRQAGSKREDENNGS